MLNEGKTHEREDSASSAINTFCAGKSKKCDKNIKIHNQVAIRKSTWFENGHLSVRKKKIDFNLLFHF